MRIIIGIEDPYPMDQYDFDSLPPMEAFSNHHFIYIYCNESPSSRQFRLKATHRWRKERKKE
jgi:hypothetical protein